MMLDEIFGRSPLMAIFRHQAPHRSLELASAAWDLGVHAVEITLQSDDDIHGLRAVADLATARGTVVGAGTIIDPAQVAVAVRAGAAFLVSPGFDPAVVQAAQSAGIPIVQGVATPSEVQRALAMDLTWLKAFPAQWLGPEWFTHLRGPFPQAKFIATGGLDATNAQRFFDAGVRVVAVGSALEDPTQLPRLAELLRHQRD
jgi:Entner-Doudoroff aldolase